MSAPLVADIEDLTCVLPLLQIWSILHECSCLLNLLNKLRKRDKMRGLSSILSLFSQRVE